MRANPTPPNPQRCEAWFVRSAEEVQQCTSDGSFGRDGHRVCLMHKSAQRIAYSEAEARKLRGRIAGRP
jgi:hypothetical protein